MSGITSTRVRTLVVVVAGLGIVACSGSSDDLTNGGSPGSNGGEQFSLSGTVDGLDGGSIELSLNDGEQVLAIEEDGAFTFDEGLLNNSGFAVRVHRQPTEPDLHCRVTGGLGVLLGADVDDIEVHCAGPAPRAISQERAITLSWQQTGPVDVLYSTDRDCDWSNYSVCDDSGIVTGTDAGELTLTVDDDGLEPDRSYFFTLENGERRSGIAAARAYRMVLDDRVESLVEHEGVVYAGGLFTGIRPETGGWVTFDDDDGQLLGTTPFLEGLVTAAVPDGEGGWYLGGDIDAVGGLARQNLAHVDALGSLTDWSAGVDGPVSSLALAEGRVIVAGRFETTNGTAQSNLAVFDARSGERLDWDGGANDAVYSLAVHEDTLYVGGGFTEADGEARNGLAAFELMSGALTSWDPGIGENVGSDDYEDAVYTLAIGGDTLYIGGNFTRAGGEARLHVAALDLDSDEARDWSASVTGPVSSLAVDNGVVFAGGRFDYTGNEGLSGLRAFDANTGDAVDWAPYVDSVVHSISVDSGRVYISGRFFSADSQFRPGLAAFDREDGALLDWNPGAGWGPAFVAGADDGVFVGGSFRQAGGINRGMIAAYDAASGELLDWAPQVDGRVGALAIYDDRLYAGGGFSIANGEDRNLIAAFELEDASLADWAANFIQDVWFTGRVNALRIADGAVYAGGDFQTADRDGHNHLAAFDADTATLLAWDSNASGSAHSLLVEDDVVYAGGSVDLDSNRQLFAFDRTSGAAVDTVPSVPDELVTALESRNDVVYVGGHYDEIDGLNQPSLASFSADTGELTDWRPSVAGSVHSMLFLDDVLYVGGSFNEADGETRNGLAAFDSASGDLHDWQPEISSFVRTLSGANGRIFIGADRPYGQTPLQPLIMAVDADSGERLWGEEE